MRKLLVLLVALVTVAAFGAVSISGSASASLKLEFDPTPAATPSITTSGSVSLTVSGNIGEKTGFYVTFSGFGVSNARMYEYIYTSDSLKIRYWLGHLTRSTNYLSVAGGALALDFDMKSGDLKDNLIVYLYFPGGTQFVDFDVLNDLTFGLVSLKLLAKGLLSAGAGKFPTLGLDGTLDIAEALNISGATLRGFAYLEIDPNKSGLAMLPEYKFGVNWGVQKFTGSAWFENTGTATVGATVETTVLDPVKVGASVSLPVNITSFSDVELGAYASWKSDLLSHKISIDVKSQKATAAWTISVSF
ncbi:MAG: hypothetical protein N2250_04130 [Pseudothermotoga sp.]|nr:hypothetical protein [Pseudothermotoga sp.]